MFSNDNTSSSDLDLKMTGDLILNLIKERDAS